MKMISFYLKIEGKTNFIAWDRIAYIEKIVETIKGETYRAGCMQYGPIRPASFILELAKRNIPKVVSL
jgi:hypothetical protein